MTFQPIIKEDTDDLRVDDHVQVGVLAILQPGVEIAVARVLPLAGRRDVAFGTLHPVVGLEIAQVFNSSALQPGACQES